MPEGGIEPLRIYRRISSWIKSYDREDDDAHGYSLSIIISDFRLLMFEYSWSVRMRICLIITTRRHSKTLKTDRFQN